MRTKMYISLIFLSLCVIMQHNVTYAKRILFISSIPSYSHQVSYRGLLLELNKRGHEIVAITPNPLKNSSLTNYTEIDLNYFYKIVTSFSFNNKWPFTNYAVTNMRLPFIEVEKVLWKLLYIFNEEVFKNPEVKKLYVANSNEHFDAVIVGQGPNPSLNAFAHRFNAPLIGIASLDVFNHLRFMFGSLILPSHSSNWQNNMNVESDAPLWTRVVNFYDVWMQIYHWMHVHVPVEDALAKKFLGEDTPHVHEITKNMSLFFVDRHPVLAHARLEQPNVIWYHGFHIAKVPPPLTEDVKKYLDDAKDGFIYVSLGTNVNWEDLPNNNTFEVFVEALSTLPYKIVWKYDPELLPKKYNNILASKWFAQQAILAHPNIKLFIYQGGLQSTEEAVYYGVPLIGFPFLWDQKFQVRNIIKLGVGLGLHYNSITKEIIQSTVHEVVTNKRYKEQMTRLSKLFKDMPYDSAENAAWWVEYVIRNKGAPALRLNLSDYAWYQRFDWDVIAFLVITAYTTAIIFLYALFRILRFMYRYKIVHNSCQDDKKLKVQ